MIYVVTGTRHPSDDLAAIARRFIHEELVPGEDELADGEAIGIDTICGTAAEERGIARHKFGVERVYGKNAWERYGRGVGHMRNALMINQFPVCCVVGFWNGYSKGTKGCLDYAEKQGKLWRVYFDNGTVWWATDDFGQAPGHSWSWRSYGPFMLDEMYQASRIAKAHQRALERVEGHFQDPEKRQAWVNAAREGYNLLMDGVRPTRREKDGTMLFASKSKKGDGHAVGAHSCSCQAGQFNRPCWARAAADLLRTLEAPPEYNRLEEHHAEFI